MKTGRWFLWMCMALLESMNNATAWQAADDEWQAQFAVMAAACGSAEDLTAHVLTMQ